MSYVRPARALRFGGWALGLTVVLWLCAQAAVRAAGAGYFSSGYLSTDGGAGLVVGGGGFNSSGRVVWGSEGAGFSVGERRGGMGLFYAGYPVYRQGDLLLFPTLGVGMGGGSIQGGQGSGGGFGEVGMRAFFLPGGRGWMVGAGLEYLFPLFGDPPRGLVVRLMIGGGAL